MKLSQKLFVSFSLFVLICVFSSFTASAQWSTPGIDTITANQEDDELTRQSLCLDNSNQFHAVWQRSRGFDGWDIFYARRTEDGAWTDTVQINDPTIGVFEPALAVNKTTQQPYIAYTKNNYIMLATLEDNSWAYTQISTNLDWDGSPTIALDGYGNVHLAWIEEIGSNAYKIRYASNQSGNWESQQLVNSELGAWGMGAMPSIDVTDDGIAHIVYRGDSGAYRVHHATNNELGGTQWEYEILSANENEDTDGVIKIGIDGTLHLFISGNDAFVGGARHTFYTKKLPDWDNWSTPVRMDLEEQTVGGMTASAFIDYFGNPHVIIDETGGNMYTGRAFYATNMSGSWTNELINLGEGHESYAGGFVIDEGGYGHVLISDHIYPDDFEVCEVTSNSQITDALSEFVGSVTDEDGEPMENVHITAGDYSTVSNELGNYSIYVTAGTYTIVANAFGYEEYISEEYVIEENGEITVDIVMTPSPSGTLTGLVFDGYENGEPPIENAKIKVLDTPLDRVFTDETGQFIMEDIPVGTYTVQASKSGYFYSETEITISADETTEENYELFPVNSFEEDDGGFTSGGGYDEWEWGVPTEDGGPALAYDGAKVWGTDLDGTYHTFSNYSLYSTSFYIPSYPDAKLVFATWYNTIEGSDGGNVQISTDDGENWELITPENGYPGYVSSLSANGFSGNSEGWQLIEIPLVDYQNEEVQFRFKFASMNNSSYGWFIDYFAVIGAEANTASVDEANISIPKRTKLHDNYPNPFNPETTIGFSLPEKSDVTLQIYNMNGQLVKTLANEKKDAGEYKVIWNGTDDAGKSVSSGIYFYRIQTGDYTDIKKAILVK